MNNDKFLWRKYFRLLKTTLFPKEHEVNEQM